MDHLEVLVEEQSAEETLKILLPRIVGNALSFRLISFQGKQDLLSKLEERLRGYRSWMPPGYGIVVLIDEDREDCRALKRALVTAAAGAGWRESRTRKPGILNRIAVEELEAWFFGDVPALRLAYPRVPATLEHRAPYRDPDQIAGGTWQALERVLQKAGYHPGGLQKIAAARAISVHMQPDGNRSRSFCVFRDGLREFVQD